MAGRPSLDKATVSFIKQLLWAGKSQSRVAILTGASQATVSRIHAGATHGDVLWPDGSTGAMPKRKATEEINWSADAARYLSFPTEMQERILAAVNRHREGMGVPPLPNATEEYQRLLELEPDDLAWDATSLAKATNAEDERLSTLMREFDSLVEEERAAMHDREAEAILKATTDSSRRNPLADVEDCYDMQADKMDWDEVVEKAPIHPLVLQVVRDKDPALREAICIVFHALKGAPKNWNTDVARKQIIEIADWIRENVNLEEQSAGQANPG